MVYIKFFACTSILCAELIFAKSQNDTTTINLSSRVTPSTNSDNLISVATYNSPDEDNAESERLYQTAQRYLDQGDSKKALIELSEILEFFPHTESWPLACLELSKIYCLDKNFHSAQLILKRLTDQPHYNESLHVEILFAQWDFYSTAEKFKDLWKWIEKLSPEEKKQLRLDQRSGERFIRMITDNKIHLNELLDLWNKLEHPSPLNALNELISKNDGYLFNKQQSGIFLDHCLSAEKIDLIESTSRFMGQNGWSEEAQRQFLAHQSDPNSELWKGVWLRFLIQHQLYQQAFDLIPKDNDSYTTELCLALIGLKNWDRSAQIIISNADWISASIPYAEMLKCAQGLASQNQYRLLLSNFLKCLKIPLQKMLETEILPSGESRIKNLSQILADDSVYGPRAGLLLAKAYLSERDLVQLIHLKEQLHLKYPSLKSTIDEVQTSIDTLQSLLRVSPRNPQQP